MPCQGQYFSAPPLIFERILERFGAERGDFFTAK